MQMVSLPQPFPWALTHAGMDLIPLNYRSLCKGLLLIHASKLVVPESKIVPQNFARDWRWIIDRWSVTHPDTPIFDSDETPMKFVDFVGVSGAIVAVAYTSGAVERSESPWWGGSQGLDRWALKIEDAIEIEPLHRSASRGSTWGVSSMLRAKVRIDPKAKAFIDAMEAKYGKDE